MRVPIRLRSGQALRFGRDDCPFGFAQGRLRQSIYLDIDLGKGTRGGNPTSRGGYRAGPSASVGMIAQAINFVVVKKVLISCFFV